MGNNLSLIVIVVTTVAIFYFEIKRFPHFHRSVWANW